MAEYISRNAVITTIKNYGKGAIAEGVKTLDPVDDIVALTEAIKWLQIADVAPVVHGRWTMSSDRPDTIICSYCQEAFDVWKADINRHNFCPNCGAKMDEVSK